MVNFRTAWQQIKILTYANMKARYRKTVIGFLWVVLNPILMYSVQAIVFKKFLKLDLPNYYIFLLGGLLPWLFINSTWDSCTTAIVNASALLKSFQISPLVILSSSILDNLINFLAAFIILGIPAILYEQSFSTSILFLPVSLFILIVFTVVTTALLATLHVFYRDIKYVTHFSMSVLFFLTPIFYPPSFIPENYRWIVDINPLYIIIAPIRLCLVDGNISDILQVQFKGLIFISLLVLIFIRIWKKKKNEIFLKL
jgi:ABC-type polysaccharide/polyol phosphate export permease